VSKKLHVTAIKNSPLIMMLSKKWSPEKSHSALERDINNFVFLMDSDKRKNYKRSFFVSFDKLHTSRNVKKNNEIIFHAIIRRGSGLTLLLS
jgi:hypothetical protein